ncbi:MAG: AbrB/MazE/SpoVT family DNA-binding domain-containing protein, partial [Desulfovibrio sp.]|nr:AbrB/MazE/SpoVT family DNA-binding domain-containing protein [Desulfovibrio sp.]
GNAKVYEDETRGISVESEPSRTLQPRYLGGDRSQGPRRLLKAAPKPTSYGGYKKCENFWTLPCLLMRIMLTAAHFRLIKRIKNLKNFGGRLMNLAKVSANGQVTVPVEVRRKLRLKEGDKLLFIERDGEIVINNASATAIVRAQAAFAGAARDFGIANDEDVQSLVDEVRYGASK